MEEKLLKLCKKFIDQNDIWSNETIYQSDCVILSAPEFIEEICDIVGYKPIDVVRMGP